MFLHPAIVVVAYNRPLSLQRLLKSIQTAEFTDDVIPLHISVDKSDDLQVIELAKGFEWPYGPKIVEEQTEHLGLKEHVLKCGKLTSKYNAIIMLEDDLIVSPHFYTFAQESLVFYAHEEKLAGISLYSYEVAESGMYPFQALRDDSDVYFMKIASSWGQIWTDQHWQNFESWFHANGESQLSMLPIYIQKWSENSWKKFFINYMIAEDRYFVFPQFSFSTNFGDRGTNSFTNNDYQTSVEIYYRKLNFQKFSQSKSIYDEYFELLPSALDLHTDIFKSFDIEIDLYGQKPIEQNSKKYFLTTKTGTDSKMSFSNKMIPLVNNILYGITGNEINLFEKGDILNTPLNTTCFFPGYYLEHNSKSTPTFLKLSIVVPITSLKINELRKTLASFQHQVSSFLECVICCNPADFLEIKTLIKDFNLPIKIITNIGNSEMELLWSGLFHANNEIMSWCRQGTTLNKETIIKLTKIFNANLQINWVGGIDENVDINSFGSVNIAKYRWNSDMVKRYGKKSVSVDTELMFWRKSFFDKIPVLESEKLNEIFYIFINTVPLTVVAYKFGDKESTNSSTLFVAERRLLIGQFKSKKENSAVNKVVSFLTYFFFIQNIPFLRSVFIESQRLPFVLRYDYQNDNFYFDRN